MNQITIGDHSFNLRVKMGVFQTILELSGKEITPFLQDSAKNFAESLAVMLIAANECYNEKFCKEPWDREFIRKVVRTDGELWHFNELLKVFIEFVNASEPGEAKTPEVKQGKTPAKPLHGRTARK